MNAHSHEQFLWDENENVIVFQMSFKTLSFKTSIRKIVDKAKGPIEHKPAISKHFLNYPVILIFQDNYKQQLANISLLLLCLYR